MITQAQEVGVRAVDDAHALAVVAVRPGVLTPESVDRCSGPRTEGDECPPVRQSSLSLSVVVATYERRDAVGRLLTGLRDQRFVVAAPDRVEVIIVNDGGSVAVESEIPEGLPFPVSVFRRPNGGPAQARHSGIEASSGDVVIIVDDDMQVDDTFLDAHLEAHSNGATVVYGPILGVDTDELADRSSAGAVSGQRDAADSLFNRFHQRHIDLWTDEMFAGATPRGDRLCTGNVSFRRSAYDGVGGFDLSLRRCEDRDLGVRLERQGERFAFAAGARARHETDHVDVEVWRRRSALYGSSDVAISKKHRADSALSPWSFLEVLPRLAHPLLIAVAVVPPLGRPLSLGVYKVAESLDSRGRQRIAVRLAGLTYGIEYYRGAGSEWGPRNVIESLREWRRVRRAVGVQPAPQAAVQEASERCR
jgi:GT2 family glycosyltransferase